ncbi:MAG TPA: CGNR zinc finger domain-containing protein [Streptosporangiaceae bacterium]|nr:CGNR zinc finger domain-containing protein [Streptosporangiaceae bacterium]
MHPVGCPSLHRACCGDHHRALARLAHVHVPSPPVFLACSALHAVVAGQKVSIGARSGSAGQADGLVLRRVRAVGRVHEVWLKSCPGHLCGWAFYDRSAAARSRWCSMQLCGSRAKMRTYRARYYPGSVSPPRAAGPARTAGGQR